METSLKTGFAQIFSRCPKNLSAQNLGGLQPPLPPPPGPYAYAKSSWRREFYMPRGYQPCQ